MALKKNLHLKLNLDFFFKNLVQHFHNSFVPRFFILSVLSFGMEHKKGIENRTAVYFCLHHEFDKMLFIFWHFAALRPNF